MKENNKAKVLKIQEKLQMLKMKRVLLDKMKNHEKMIGEMILINKIFKLNARVWRRIKFQTSKINKKPTKLINIKKIMFISFMTVSINISKSQILI